jgi:LacI family transcriptional regulator
MHVAHTIVFGDIPRVAVLLDASSSVKRDFVLGISRYARLKGPWNLHVGSCWPEELVPKIKSWGAHGVISAIHDSRACEALLAASIPTVAVCSKDESCSSISGLSQLSYVSLDAAESVANLTVEHFLERQFRHFAFVGYRGVAWSELRQEAFRKGLQQHGFVLHAFERPTLPSSEGWQQDCRPWQPDQTALTDWLRNLPRPVAVLAANDERACMVLDCCRSVGLKVPEQVAVLGVDNDEMFCNMSDPPLSSIVLGAHHAGFRAAAMLHEMIQGRDRSSRQLVAEAICLVTRRSTDVVAVNDSDVAAALRFIREKYASPITVDEVADSVLLSRRTLEKRFRNILGKTVLDDIHAVRIEHAKRLLLETKEPIQTVARLSGFGTAEYFIRFFRQRHGMPPGQFRGGACCGEIAGVGE